MEEASKIILAALLVTTLLITLLQNSDANCGALEKQLDKHTDSESTSNLFLIRPTEDECKKWDGDKNPIRIGGTLVNQSCAFDNARGSYACELLFKGEAKNGILLAVKQTPAPPYQLNEFYSFDLGNYCSTRYSAALSGSFVIKNGSELKKIECKKA